MSHLYEFGHNRAFSTGEPEIEEIANGIADLGTCKSCRGSLRHLDGDLAVRLGSHRSNCWSDVLPCGDYPALVISEKFASACGDAGVEITIGGVVQIVEPLENGLAIESSPQYLWVDGNRHFGAKVDFEASGYVGVRFCSECGRRMDDVAATYDRQHATPPPPTVFIEGSYTGLDLFTTDISPTAFFCTQKVVDLATEHRLTNCRFTPVEAGLNGQPIDYLTSR